MDKTSKAPDNRFPQMLYKGGGSEAIHGGHFHTCTVGDADELKAALGDGWHETTPEARAAYEDERSGSVGGKPTREELEQKAGELGIAFSAKVSDKKLAEAIAAKLGENGGK